jgi:integrase/recombinase XerD
MNNLLENFLTDLEFRSKSKETYNRFKYVVQKFIEFTKKDANYDKKDIVTYIVALKRNGCSESYQRFIFYVLKSFYQSNKIPWEFRPKEAPPESTHVTPFLTVEQGQKMMELAKVKLRDYIILRIGMTLGLRRIEIRDLNRKDYVPPKLFVLDTAKHGNPRPLDVDYETIQALNSYLSKRTDNDEALFVSNQVKRFSLVGLSDIFTKYKKMAGIKGERMGMHSMRRGLATGLRKAGMGTDDITKFMGWKTPFMVNRYIQISGQEISEKVRRVNPFLKKS